METLLGGVALGLFVLLFVAMMCVGSLAVRINELLASADRVRSQKEAAEEKLSSLKERIRDALDEGDE